MSVTAESLIRVRDAHLNNLRNVDVELPRGCVVAVTGVSGSGKSSLAFGTIHGEGQRRYLESVAPFARRLIGSAVDPQVGSIEGLPPTVALEQNTTGAGARSTVGTVSALSNSLRLLFSRSGDNPKGLYAEHFSPNTPQGMCPACQGTGIQHEPTEATMVPDPSLTIREGAIAAWPGAWAGKNFRDILDALGYPLDTPWRDIPAADREWILFTDERPVVTITPHRGADQVQRQYEGTWRSAASYLRKTLAETESETLRKRTLSFMEHQTCPVCQGRRLGQDALAVTYLGEPIDALSSWPLQRLHEVLAARAATIAADSAADAELSAEALLLKNLLPTLESALELGLGHLTVDRAAETLSAGELQRVRLASQLRSGLFGVAYVLDEPSAGLHPEEREAVSRLCRRFVAAGNSVLLVEHDMNLVAQADWIVDVGPVAGEGGGTVMYSGLLADYLESTDSAVQASPTFQALRQRNDTMLGAPSESTNDTAMLSLRGLDQHNLRCIDVDIPQGTFTALAGVSGSGKTTVLNALRDCELEDLVDSGAERGGVDKRVFISHKPIGRTPRSTLATYTGLWDHVRKLLAGTPEAKARGWNVSRFSYNVAKGQCPTCAGAGKIEVELIFLPGSYTTCPDCAGQRYNPETLEVTWNGLNAAQLLDLTVDDAVEVFAEHKVLSRIVATLRDIGLGYLRLGQGAPELSGGEAQRIKLATELHASRNTRKKVLYLMDEPTTGLHPADAALLTAQLRAVVDAGHTVVVVEHDLGVIAQADHVIEMGPGAGADGGDLLFAGTPAELVGLDTATGRMLARFTVR